MYTRSNGSRRHVRILGGDHQVYSPSQKGRIPTKLIDYLLQKGEFAKSGHPHVKFVNIPERFTRNIPLNQVHDAGESLQLLLKIPARLDNGDEVVLSALIDTGAEANLVQTRVLPSSMFFPAQTPLNLVTANGCPLMGGRSCVHVTFSLIQEVNGRILSCPKYFDANFTRRTYK